MLNKVKQSLAPAIYKFRSLSVLKKLNRKTSIVLVAVVFGVIGVVTVLLSSAATITLSNDPNTVVIQYSLPHIMMPKNNQKLSKPMYAPFTLYGNGLLICGQNGEGQFNPVSPYHPGMNMEDMMGLPTSKTLTSTQMIDLVQRINGTGFDNLKAEYFKQPAGSSRHMLRVNTQQADKVVMYYADTEAPKAYVDTLKILSDTCAAGTEPYVSSTVKINTLKKGTASRGTVNIDTQAPVVASALKKALPAADEKRSRVAAGAPGLLQDNPSSTAAAASEVSNTDAKELVKSFSGKPTKSYSSGTTEYEIGVQPVPPQVKNPVKLDIKAIREKSSSSKTRSLSIFKTPKASAQTATKPQSLPVRVVILIPTDGGDSSIISDFQTRGQAVYNWYCGQVGKCFTYQGIQIMQGSRTKAQYMTCTKDPNFSTCRGAMDATIDNIWKGDKGTIYRSDVDTLVVTGWNVDSVSSGICGLGYVGDNLSIVDGFAPTISRPAANGGFCGTTAPLAHEIGHNFTLDHTGNGTLMDGSPYSQFAADCDINVAAKSTCSLDSAQIAALSSPNYSYIFNQGYNFTASTTSVTPLYRYWSESTGDHYYLMDRIDNQLSPTYKFENCEASVYTTAQAKMVPLWRYWNSARTDHFYTVDRNDAGYAQSGWYLQRQEGFVYPTTFGQPKGSVPLYRYWNTTISDHFYTVDRNDAGYAGYGYAFEKVEAYVPPPPSGRCNNYVSTPLWRYWNTTVKDHFYTIDRNDGGYAGFGYRLEKCEAGVWTNQYLGMVPLWRYWNGTNRDHFYTTDRNDAGYAYYGYAFEKNEGFVYPPSNGNVGVPLYRYWNPGLGDHFYTTNWGELGYGASGWQFESLAAYVKPLSSSCS